MHNDLVRPPPSTRCGPQPLNVAGVITPLHCSREDLTDDTACKPMLQVDDCIAFEQLVSKRYDGDVPFFLGGQSMGGFVAAHVVLRQSRKWAGVILTSPAIDVDRTLILR